MRTVVAQLNAFQVLSRLSQESSFPEESINKHSKEFFSVFHSPDLLWNGVVYNYQHWYSYIMLNRNYGRSQWPRGLRHELHLPALTLGSWVRIPLEAWMTVRLFCVCGVLCVGSSFATGWFPSKESYLLRVKKSRDWKSGQYTCRYIDR
jgi:hypothetical protein